MSTNKTNNFAKIINKVNKLSGNSEIRFKDLFNNKFMLNYTEFESINQMFQESDFDIKSEEDFNNISEDQLDEYVKQNTKFSNWEEMIEMAIEKWIKKEL